MAADYPIDVEGTAKESFLDLCDSVFLGIYTFEMGVKMIAYGVHCGEGGCKLHTQSNQTRVAYASSSACHG